MRHRRNQGDKPPAASGPAPARKGVGGTIKNLLILAVVGVGGYIAWKKIGGIDFGITGGGGGRSQAAPPGVPQPDLKGPKVVPGMTYSTLSQQCITQPDPRFKYSPVTQTDVQGYQSFQSVAKGNFTRRMLCAGGRKWAEIAPAGYRAIN